MRTVRYPSGLTVRHTYNAHGYLSGIVNHAGGTVLETYGARDAYGNVSEETYGNGVGTTRAFEAGSGRLTGIGTQFEQTVDAVTSTTTLQDNAYRWRTNGILTRRSASGGRAETFAYDGLNRLLTATAARSGTSLRTLTTGYGTTVDKLGNPASMTSSVTADADVTSMAYGSRTATAAPGADALTSATIAGTVNTLWHDDAGNVTRYDRASGDDRFIAWDARNLPVSVTEAPCAMRTRWRTTVPPPLPRARARRSATGRRRSATTASPVGGRTWRNARKRPSTPAAALRSCASPARTRSP